VYDIDHLSWQFISFINKALCWSCCYCVSVSIIACKLNLSTYATVLLTAGLLQTPFQIMSSHPSLVAFATRSQTLNHTCSFAGQLPFRSSARASSVSRLTPTVPVRSTPYDASPNDGRPRAEKDYWSQVTRSIMTVRDAWKGNGAVAL